MLKNKRKIKIGIGKDELYPFYCMWEGNKKDYGNEVEIDVKEYKQIKKVMEKFKKVQDRLKKLLNK